VSCASWSGTSVWVEVHGGVPLSTIFLSSVQKELADERRAVKAFVEGDALLRKFFSVFLFEDLPADDRRANAVYLDEVDRCSVYVGVFGNEYGFEDAAGVSPTEREFDRATHKGKPRLIFVKGAGDSGRHPKMVALVRKAGDQLIRRRFSGKPELLASLYASLVEHMERTGALRTRPFDASACSGATIADVSEERVRWFLRRAKSERQFALPENAPVTDVLTHLNLLEGDVPTNAGILLFGDKPQRFLPTSEVKCLHFHGTEVQKPIPSYQIYKGTVFQLVDQAVDFVQGKLARTVGTRSRGPAAPVAYDLPLEAVSEAIVNAVAHRDYTSNASVQVMLFSDRLEIWNPGELAPSLTFARLRKPHPSIPRNPLLAEPLFLARYIEKAWTGTLDIIERLRLAGLPEPDFLQEGGTFINRLWRRDRAAEPIGDLEGIPVVRESGPDSRPDSRPESRPEWWRLGTQWNPAWAPESVHDRIMAAVQARPLSRAEMAKALGHKGISGSLGRAVDDLVKSSLLEFTIPEKPGSRLQRYRPIRPQEKHE